MKTFSAQLLLSLLVALVFLSSSAEAFNHPQLGRFLNRDPIGYSGGDTNLYAYVRGRPTVGVDPSGLEGWLPDYLEGQEGWSPDYIEGKEGWFPDFLVGATSPYGMAVAGIGQGGANTVNGVQDIGVGVINLPGMMVNGTNYVFGGDGTVVGYVPSPGWAHNLIVEEGQTSHNISKFCGGQGAFMIITMGSSVYVQAARPAQLTHVTSTGGGVGIAAENVINGAHGIYASAATKPSWWQVLVRPGNATTHVPISSTAASAFRPAPAVGPISGWTNLFGKPYWAPYSSVNLANGATTPLSLPAQYPILVDAFAGQMLTIAPQAANGTGLPGQLIGTQQRPFRPARPVLMMAPIPIESLSPCECERILNGP